jgi:hypothetical protein
MIRFLLLGVMLWMCGCISYKFPVLIPDVSPDLISESGYITQKADSVNITFGHLQTTPQFWVFSVRIINRGKSPLRVEPDKFSYKVIDVENKTQSIPYFAHSREYLLNYAQIEFGKEAARLSYKELTPRLVQNFDSYLLKRGMATDTLALVGVVYFPKHATAKNLLFNFKIDSLDFETPFLKKEKSMVQIQQD